MTGDPFEHDDAAYVLGSLSTADRDAFEAHLESCEDCIRRVAALWPTPNLLRLAPPRAFSSDVSEFTDLPSRGDTTDPAPTLNTHFGGVEEQSAPSAAQLPEELLPSMLRAVRRERGRRRLMDRALVAVAAACIAAMVAILTVGRPHASVTSASGPAYTTTVSTPILAAHVSVTPHDSWDQVNLACTYTSQIYRPGNYTAVATDRTGRREVIGSWPAIPGQTVVVRTPTSFHAGDISMISIMDTAGEAVAKMPI